MRLMMKFLRERRQNKSCHLLTRIILNLINFFRFYLIRNYYLTVNDLTGPYKHNFNFTIVILLKLTLFQNHPT